MIEKYGPTEDYRELAQDERWKYYYRYQLIINNGSFSFTTTTTIYNINLGLYIAQYIDDVAKRSTGTCTLLHPSCDSDAPEHNVGILSTPWGIFQPSETVFATYYLEGQSMTSKMISPPR